MLALDWIILVVVLGSMLLGAWRGLVFEALSLGGWIAAFFVARAAAPLAAGWLPMADSAEGLRYAAGFVLLFVATAFACGLVATLLRKAVKAMGMRVADRTFGAAFGLLRAGFILLLLTAGVHLLDMAGEDWWAASLSSPWMDLAWQQLQIWWPAAGAATTAQQV